jgi:thioredoxin-like negative regulator of GroEL
MSIPTLLVLEHGEIVARTMGAQPKEQLLELLPE